MESVDEREQSAVSCKTGLSKDTDPRRTTAVSYCYSQEIQELTVMNAVWNTIQIPANLREKNMNLDVL